jgi:hypothetical protein
MLYKNHMLVVAAVCVMQLPVQSHIVNDNSHTFYTSDRQVIDSVIGFFTDKIDADSMLFFTQQLVDFGTRFCLADNRREVADFIGQTFGRFGPYEVHLDSFLLSYTYSGEDYETWQYNVVASLKGHQPGDSVYILGAHYDTIVPIADNPFSQAPGANDNASGVAAALEIARVFALHNYSPAHTIEFIAFGAEELGLHGSYHYANQAKIQQKNIIAMINNDMISYATQPRENWTVQIHHYDNSRWLTNLAHDIISNHTVLHAVETQRYIRNTDSWPFFRQDYHAIFFHQDEETRFYHTTDDLLEHTNRDYAAEMAKISMGMLIHQNGTGIHTGIIRSPIHNNSQQTRIFFDGQQLRIIFDEELPGRLLQIYDLYGRLVFSERMAEGIDFRYATDLGRGVFLVRILDAMGHTAKTVIY